MQPQTGISAVQIERMLSAEGRAFADARPRSLALTERARATMPRGVPMAWMDDLYDHPTVWVGTGQGARFTDIDGNGYLRALIRLYLANRGVWESGWWLGPTASIAHTAADVDTYLTVFREFLAEATA